MEFLRKISEKNVKRKAKIEEGISVHNQELLAKHPEFPHLEGCKRNNGLKKIYEYDMSPFSTGPGQYYFTGTARCLNCGISSQLNAE